MQSISQTFEKGGAMVPCEKEKEIDHICERIDKIEENIEGNGKPGMKFELGEIKIEQRHMNTFLKDLNTNMAAVMKFMIESQMSSRIKLQTRDVVNMVITAILSASAIATAFIVAGGR